MDIYREINNNECFNQKRNDIILRHVLNSGNLSLDDLELENAIKYDEEREDYYPMSYISRRDLERTVNSLNDTLTYYETHTFCGTPGFLDELKKARDILKDEIDKVDVSTYYVVTI